VASQGLSSKKLVSWCVIGRKQGVGGGGGGGIFGPKRNEVI
jgi:hypothetical protein